MFQTIVANRNWHTRGTCAIDRIDAMRRQEIKVYHTPKQSFPQSEIRIDDKKIRVNGKWREKICSWYFDIVDYFHLSRQTVAISLDLFDRFFAKRGDECDENLALLASLTILYIVIKTHDTKEFKLCDIARLCVGEFLPDDILRMELKILKALKWRVNPPTIVDYIFHILFFSPANSNTPDRTIFELSCYVAEISLFDSYFIGMPRSIIAFASILNVLEDEICPFYCPVNYKEEFLNNLFMYLGFEREEGEVNSARKRLRSLLSTTRL